MHLKSTQKYTVLLIANRHLVKSKVEADFREINLIIISRQESILPFRIIFVFQMANSNQIWKYKAFFKWYLTANTIYDIHSPNLYPVVEALEYETISPVHLKGIQQFFRALSLQKKKFDLVDRGASQDQPKRNMDFSRFAEKSRSPMFNYKRLYRLAKYLNAKEVLELGTGSASGHYVLRKAVPEAQITSIDADAFLTEMGKENLGQYQTSSQFICSTFKEFWNMDLAQSQTWDLIVIDGDHRGEAMYQNFNSILKWSKQQLHQPCMYWDDIRWSPDAFAGWTKICSEYEGIAIDYFNFGLLVPTKYANSRQTVSVIPYLAKVWRCGFL